MSAELLREAADKMREVADDVAAQPQTSATVTGVWLNSRLHATVSAEFLSALAFLLDGIAADFSDPDDYAPSDYTGTALLLARIYLGQP